MGFPTMPAVQMDRLKAQITQLSWQYTQPVEYRRSLHDFMEQYSERVYRAGSAVQSSKMYRSHHLPPLIMRQLELELIVRTRENSGAALLLADELWQDEYVEPRLLAGFLLGQAALEPVDEVTRRLQTWCQPAEERTALANLLDQGCLRLRNERTDIWLGLISDWLGNASPNVQAMGIKAMLPAVKDRDWENLPPIYQALTPMLVVSPLKNQNELQEVLIALARRSPRETVFTLRQMLSNTTRPDLFRLVRRCLPSFPQQAQESLSAVLKNAPM